MKEKKAVRVKVQDDDIGCIGDYDGKDRMCFKFCALRLRCAIESSHHIQAEILEELMYSETFSEKNQ
jgi:hypothetical protein